MLDWLCRLLPAGNLAARLAAQQPQPSEVVIKLRTHMCDWVDSSTARTELAAPVVEPAIRDLLIAAERAGAASGRRLAQQVALPMFAFLLLLIVIAVSA